MVRFIIHVEMEAVKDVRDLHSNMVRFIMKLKSMVNIIFTIFTFQYG